MGLLVHGMLLFFTHESTYDAYVHMFFAEHYAQNWFETWNYKWYTGFTITSYPPLVHQMMALMSKFIGLKLAFVAWGFFVVAVFIRGVYHFSKLFVQDKAAVYAAFAAVFSFSFVEALHVFGQLPSITGIAFVLNACPEVYKFFRYKKWFHFVSAISFLSVTTAAHHVSTIFGAVFFVAPIIGMALIDSCAVSHGGLNNFKLKEFLNEIKSNLPRLMIFGIVLIGVVLFVVFPYWYWSKTDPISQVPIPHGSRGDFLADTNLGLVFFLIPWGFLAFILPFFFIKLFNRRNIFLGLSFALAFILGTGGTTPIPKWILGENAFNILTLDRFTFWASLMALPFWGLFIYELFEGELKRKILRYLGSFYHKLALGTFAMLLIIASTLIVNLNYFRPLQPDKIDIDPIVKFLNTDDHDNWRYLTLGFGDQVAWLSANTKALTVDGNYHSARRLPEMTSRPVERLENSKYLGMAGLGALQQFLTIPEKYHLKYIFSNDKFYDPLLYFSGWEKLGPLENGINVWEKPDVQPLPNILPKKTIPKYQMMIWGLVPLSCFFLMILINLLGRNEGKEEENKILDLAVQASKEKEHLINKYKWWITGLFFLVTSSVFTFAVSKKQLTQTEQISPNSVVESYFNHLDFRNFDKAYQLISTKDKPSFQQFMLEQNIENGLLASFAKLDRVEILDTSYKNETLVHVKATANWITAVKAYQSQHKFVCELTDGDWYIKHQRMDQSTPPDKFYSIPNVEFRAQGRRKANANKTDKRDVLDRPEVFISESRLVKKDSVYVLIGTMQNVDDVPAYISLKSILYDGDGKEMLTYNARDVIQHHLMPKEKASFKIEFEEIAWQKTFAELPKKFDPNYKNAFEFLSEPRDFKIFAKALVSDHKNYNHVGFTNIDCSKADVKGSIHNYGVEAITIPQIISSWYNKNQELIWIERYYHDSGIRPQRNENFQISFPSLRDVEILVEGEEDDVYVNGIISRHFKPKNSERQGVPFDWIKTDDPNAPYLNLTINNFIDR